MRQSGPSQLRVLLLFCGWWVLCFLFYWWFICKSQKEHFAAAALIGLATALGLLALRSQAGLHFAPKLAWFGLLLRRLPGEVLRDLILVGGELGRALVRRQHPTGAYKQVPFNPGQDDPASAARRALVVAAISTPPNSFVASVDRERQVLLVHQLVSRAGAHPDRDWPV